MNYLQIRDLRHSTDIKNLLEVAIATTSLAVLAEPDTVDDHANRVALAKAAAKNGATITDKLMWVLALNETLQSVAGGTVEQKQAVVQAIVDGVFASPEVVQALLSI